jgi:hypothetical protein
MVIPPRHAFGRRLLQPLLMGSAILTAMAVAGASLTNRPAIRTQPPLATQALHRDPGFRNTLAILDQQLTAIAQHAELETAAAADTLTIARRLSLALIGSGMSLEEIRALQTIPPAKQLAWWTDYLLADERWADYFAERLTRAWVGTEDGPFLLFRRRKLNFWLSEQLQTGVAYDKIVRSMLSAEGLWTDTPQVNFITATMDDASRGRGDPIRLAGRTSRALLAQRIDCLQCHDDFLGQLNFGTVDDPRGGLQTDFHQLAAFYAGTALADPVFRGIKEDGREYKYQFLGETVERSVEPAVPFYPQLLPADGKPRQRLAAWVTHADNRAFARATVNRVWALMFSRPLVEPVDSIPLDNSVPPMLDTLASDFVQHDYDLRRLIRLIATSAAFTRDSRAEFAIHEAHERAWCVFPLSQLRPEQVVGSLFQASKLTAIDSTSSIATRLAVFDGTQKFLKRFGDRGEDEFASDAVTISQRLVLMNGNLVAERTKADLINNAATRIAAIVADDRQAIELISLSILNRRPTELELQTFCGHLEGKRRQTRQRGMGDIAWAMLNSTEFSWNH